jgi:hypothetical protein
MGCEPAPAWEITPERIAEITRRARVERSKAVWELLQRMFANRADERVRKLQSRSSTYTCSG